MCTYKIFNFQKRELALPYKPLHVNVISEAVLAKTNKQKPYTHHNQTPDTL